MPVTACGEDGQPHMLPPMTASDAHRAVCPGAGTRSSRDAAAVTGTSCRPDSCIGCERYHLRLIEEPSLQSHDSSRLQLASIHAMRDARASSPEVSECRCNSAVWLDIAISG